MQGTMPNRDDDVHIEPEARVQAQPVLDLQRVRDFEGELGFASMEELAGSVAKKERGVAMSRITREKARVEKQKAMQPGQPAAESGAAQHDPLSDTISDPLPDRLTPEQGRLFYIASRVPSLICTICHVNEAARTVRAYLPWIHYCDDCASAGRLGIELAKRSEQPNAPVVVHASNATVCTEHGPTTTIRGRKCKLLDIGSPEPSVSERPYIQAGWCQQCQQFLPPRATDLGHVGLWPISVEVHREHVLLRGNKKPVFTDIPGVRHLYFSRLKAHASADGMLDAKIFEGIDASTMMRADLTDNPKQKIRDSLTLFGATKTAIETSLPLLRPDEAICYVCSKGAHAVCLDGTTAVETTAHANPAYFDNGPDNRKHAYIHSDEEVYGMSREAFPKQRAPTNVILPFIDDASGTNMHKCGDTNQNCTTELPTTTPPPGKITGYKCCVSGQCDHKITYRDGAALLPVHEHFGAVRGVLWGILAHPSFRGMCLGIEDVCGMGHVDIGIYRKFLWF